MIVEEDYQRIVLYEQLQRDFAELAKALGGWESESGVDLDGKLWAMSDRLRVAGLKTWPPELAGLAGR